MIILDKNDPIVTQILTNVPTEFHAFLKEALDAGVSRQKFKMFKCVIDNGKSMKILEQIKKCDFETADGFAEAVNLSGVHTHLKYINKFSMPSSVTATGCFHE